MGSWFSNFHIHKRNTFTEEAVMDALIHLMAEKGYRQTEDAESADGQIVLLQENAEWITVWSDLLPHDDPRGYVFIGASLLVRQNSPEMEELRARFAAEAEARRPKKVRFIQINWGARRLTKAE